ncbi:MAG: hypothetical protein A3I66_21425 [Burkholderiales bacterium RIFCSPLOWO2_02_FULL_57_36]|nr:MAG: hypothetical protein A3I66_21425 [Burkholderiales bacterium RIFCSPLOWO2_02_FULL_57_36]
MIRTETALSRLHADEICEIVLPDGTTRHASWDPLNRSFHFCDGLGVGVASHDDVKEWMPASVDLNKYKDKK